MSLLKVFLKLMALFSILFVNHAFAQNIEWENTIDGSLEDKPCAIAQRTPL